MRLSIASLFLSAAGLVASLPAPAKSYSVVNVDGQTGAAGAPAETGSAQSTTTPDATITATATITPTVTQIEVSSATQTILSTLIITQPSFEQTIVVTITQVQTTTATPSASSTEYYDDGMWHTRYPKKPEPTNGAWSNSSASA